MIDIRLGPSRTVTLEVSDFERTVKVLGDLVNAIKAEAQGSEDPEVWHDLVALSLLEYALNPDEVPD